MCKITVIKDLTLVKTQHYCIVCMYCTAHILCKKNLGKVFQEYLAFSSDFKKFKVYFEQLCSKRQVGSITATSSQYSDS